jgi:hypothetical protein
MNMINPSQRRKLLIALETSALSMLFVATSLATTLSGVLNNPDGTGFNGNLYISLSQQAALAASCGGPVQVVPVYEVRIKVTAGALVAPPAIFGNDCLLPQGTFYNIRMVDGNGNQLYTDRWLIQGTTQDIGAIVSVVISGTTQTLGGVGILQTVPTGDQTVTQPVGTNLKVNNLQALTNFSMSGVLTCNVASGCAFTSGSFVNGLTTGSTSNSVIFVGSGGNFYNRTISGGDANCTGITDGWTAFRADTHTLEVCLGGVVRKVPLI